MPTAVLIRWGNSLALKVPREMTENGRFREGEHFEVDVDAEGLHFRKAGTIRKYDIKSVLETILPEENGELDWGRPVGKEAL